MKNHIIIALSILTLASCSGKDPIYWFTEEATAGGAGSNIPYYPTKPSDGSDVSADGYAPANYTLVWNDEFDNPTSIYSNWYFEEGGAPGDGWGNHELQYYCDGGYYKPTDQYTASVDREAGTLKIKAFKIDPSSASNNCEYISTRMNTKESWQYGYVEMRAKLPTTAGCWSAFWMLLQDGPSYVRDESGKGAEIDIMEYVPGDQPNRIYFSGHSYNATKEAGENTGYNGHSYCQSTWVPEPGEWHCYGMKWTHEEIRGYCDGKEFFYIPNPTPDVVDYATWPFDQKFYLKLNLAVGGDWGGKPASGFREETFEIDWVRVYADNGQVTPPDTRVEDLLTSTQWELVKVTEDWGESFADMVDAAGDKLTFNSDHTLAFDCSAKGGLTHDYYFSGEDFEPYDVDQMSWSLNADQMKLTFPAGSYPLVILNEGEITYDIVAIDESQLVLSVNQWGETYSITFKPATESPVLSLEQLLTATQWELKGVLEEGGSVDTSVGNKLTLNSDHTMAFDRSANEGLTFDHTWEGTMIDPNIYGEVSGMRWSAYTDDGKDYLEVENGFLLVFAQEDVAGVYEIKELTTNKLTVDITTYEETWTLLFEAAK